MQDDNVYPNQGDYFAPIAPEEQEREQQIEKADVISGMPVIQKVIEHFNERILFYSQVQSISDEVMTNPDEFMHAVATNKLTVNCLVNEKERLEGLVKEYQD